MIATNMALRRLYNRMT